MRSILAAGHVELQQVLQIRDEHGNPVDDLEQLIRRDAQDVQADGSRSASTSSQQGRPLPDHLSTH